MVTHLAQVDPYAEGHLERPLEASSVEAATVLLSAPRVPVARVAVSALDTVAASQAELVPVAALTAVGVAVEPVVALKLPLPVTLALERPFAVSVERAVCFGLLLQSCSSNCHHDPEPPSKLLLRPGPGRFSWSLCLVWMLSVRRTLAMIQDLLSRAMRRIQRPLSPHALWPAPHDPAKQYCRQLSS